MYRDNVRRTFNNNITITDTCWLWDRRLTCGYGQMHIKDRYEMAHRVSYKLYKGHIPEGKIVMHTCDVRNCVNPDHLTVGTHKDNTQDMIAKGRQVIVKQDTKISDEEVLCIRRHLAQGYINYLSHRQLAKMFDVSPKVIFDIKHNQGRYKDIL